ncbi:MAG: PilZ domain-containing protein [Candidatus Electrothrix sp. AR4]|nr:PilZ domain-containing protein [Candidatus Electrothrix sp. AR4]
MATIIAHVRPDNRTSIVCPSCSRVRQLSVKKFRKTSHSITAHCTCNARFTIHLDFRHYYRKKVDLPGTWEVISPPGEENGPMRIQNISQNGACFTVIDPDELKDKEILLLKFQLDDHKKTKLIREARICTIKNNQIGCTFINRPIFEKELGFYLTP